MGNYRNTVVNKKEQEGTRIRARQLVERLGRRLIREHPEIAELYQQGDYTTYLSLAQQYLPRKAEEHPGVASRAVGYAIRILMDPEERRRIVSERASKRMKKQLAELTSEELRTQAIEAAKKRHEGQTGVDVLAMLEGKGITPWGTQEKLDALTLASDEQYHYTNGGSRKGRPNYSLIAPELNR